MTVLPLYTSTYTLHGIKAIELEVLAILNILDVNKAAGLENISTKFLGTVHYLYSNQSATCLQYAYQLVVYQLSSESMHCIS